MMVPLFGRMAVSTAVTATLAACQPAPQRQMIAGIYDMSSAQFGLRVIAPADRISDYAICKATWFAEHMRASTLSLGKPEYKTPETSPGLVGQVPGDWAVLDTKVYLTNPNPDGNLVISVPERAQVCRSAWEWYGR